MPDEPGVAGRIFGALADANINVDMIIQNEPVSHDGGADLSFTVEADDLEAAEEAIRIEDSEIGIETDEAMGKVSIVGAGMRSHPGVAAKVFRVLGENKINIEMISTSPIKISCVIRADQVPAGRRGPPHGLRARRGRDPQGGADRHRAPPDRSVSASSLIRTPWAWPRTANTESGSSAPRAPSARRSSRCSPSASFPAREVRAARLGALRGQQGEVRAARSSRCRS